MIISFLENMTTTEKIFLFLVIILLIALILIYNKFKRYSKETLEQQFVTEQITPISTTTTLEQESDDQLELDNVLEEMRKSLMEQKVDPVRTFEEEQEEKSIISYQELLRANETEEFKEEELAEVSISEEEQINKFKKSEFISPVYGRVNNEIKYPKIPKIRRAKLGDDESDVFIEEEHMIDMLDSKIETLNFEVENETTIEDLEQTLSSTKLKEEMFENEKFLNTLKEFRSSLE